MPSSDLWAGNAFPLSAYLDDVDPGVDTAVLIADKSTSITIIRSGSAQAAQTVRIEQLGGSGSGSSEAGETGRYDIVVIGYKGHPTITDTSIQRGDRFVVGGVMYDVEMVMPGEVNSVQAYAKVRA